MKNEVIKQIEKILKENDGDFILCYSVKIDDEDGCIVHSRSANTNQILMLRHILAHIISTGKENGVSKSEAKEHFIDVVSEMIDYVYDKADGEDNE